MFLLYLCAFPATFYFVNLMYNVQRVSPAFACLAGHGIPATIKVRDYN